LAGFFIYTVGMKNTFFKHKFFSPKIWRRVARVVVVVLCLYLLLLTGLSIYISSSKERLIGFLTGKMKETILGELKVDKADITVWQTFPKIGISLTNVSISDSFYHTPFLSAKQITAKFGLLDLVGSKLRINTVEVRDAVFHTFTDTSGYTNSYVLRPQNKPRREKSKPVQFENLELINVTAISEDAIKKKRYEVVIKEADADISMQGSRYKIDLNEDMIIRGLGFYVPKGSWLQNQRVQARWKLEFDTTGNILSFNNTKVRIQGHPFMIKGAFFLNGPAHFHIDASTSDISYDAALAILKPTTSAKINKIKMSKGLDAKIMIDGPLAYRSLPLVRLDFSSHDNDLSTPVVNLNSCSFSGNFINQVDPKKPRTDDNSRVSLYSLQSNWGDINLKAQNIAVTNLLQPVIQFEFYSQCTLAQLDDQLASSTLRFINGDANLYLSYNGPLISNASLLDQVNAKIQVRNGKIVYVPRSLTFSECDGTVVITGNTLLINNFKCNLNTNHFVVNITGSELNRISHFEPGKATINCDVFSPSLDLADLKALFAKRQQTAVRKKTRGLGGISNAVDNAVERGNLYINMHADELRLHHFEAHKVIANAVFQENDWQIKQASLQHADGNFSLSAKVHQLSDDSQLADVLINLQHIDVKKLFYGFDNFGQTSITSSNLKGSMDAKANIVSGMDSHGKLITSTMNGQLYFSLKNGALINHEPLQRIQQYVLKNRDLKNVEFAELTDTFDIKNGDIYIHRMPIQSSALTMYVEGIYSFADRTDISIQVPLTGLVKKSGKFDKNDNDPGRPGPSIYLRAKDKNGQVKVGLDLFKKFRKDNYGKHLNDSL